MQPIVDGDKVILSLTKEKEPKLVRFNFKTREVFNLGCLI